MITEHFPALQVVIPLLAAPACVLLHRAERCWLLAMLVGVLSLAISVALLVEVQLSGTISYALGGWAAPWGIEYRVDLVNAFVLLIVSGINLVALPFARLSAAREIEAQRLYLFYTAWLLCLTGLLGITITGDAFNVFVFLEISSLATYILISLGRDRRGLLAAFRYLMLGTIGATFILIGVGLMYMMTGTLNMADLAARLPDVRGSRTLTVAFAFLFVGVGIKMALFPLHLWLPNAYTYAPSAVTVLLSGTATKVAVYVLLRFFLTVFGAEFTFGELHLDRLLVPLAAAGVLSASVVALYQSDVKRLLAYSSIAQIGYMALGVGLASVTGLTAALIHLFNHALIKAALFMALGCVSYRIGSVALADLGGIGRRMPWTMAAFVVGGLSLIGVPLTAGFISKWYLIQGALEKDWWWLALIVLVSSLVSVFYVWRVVEVAYFRPAPDNAGTGGESPPSLLVPTWLLIVANVYFGIDTTLTRGVAQRAASLLLTGSA